MAEDKKVKEPEKTEEAVEEPTKIKVGDEEYTEEDLGKLVGLGKTAREFEEKYDRPIAEYYPKYIEATGELAQIKKAQEAEKAAAAEEEAKRVAGLPREKLTPEQTRELAIKQAEDLGLLHKGNIRESVAEIIEGYRLLDDVGGILAEAKEAGKPTVSTDEFLKFMNERGIRNPDDAYQIMFRDELKKLDQEKLEGIKKEGLKTQEGSTAGSKKQPTALPPVDKESLRKSLKGYMAGREGKTS